MSDKLDKYRKTDYPPLGKQNVPKLITPKKGYEAFTLAKGMEKGESFRIYDQNGNFDFYSYNHVIEGSFRNGSLIITTSSRIYTVTGDNIEKLAELFSDKRVKSIYEFNPDKHEAPDKNKAVIINKIERED